MRLFSHVVFALSGLFIAQAASATEITVPAGKRSGVASFGTYNAFACRGGPVPDVKISRQTSHGHLDVVVMKVPMDKINMKCTGETYTAAVVVYTPSGKYVGPDSGSVGVAMSGTGISAGGTTLNNQQDINIMVK